IKLETGKSLFASRLAYQPHAFLHGGGAPGGNIRRCGAAISEGNSGKADDIGLTRGEGQQAWTVAADQNRRMRLLDRKRGDGMAGDLIVRTGKSDVFALEETLDHGDRLGESLDPDPAWIEVQPGL